jgi:uncharacterized protein DUF302
VAATLKKKLNHEMPPYRILGACNPPLAHRALEAEPSIGLLLPCNVVVRQDAAGKVHVEFMDPNAVLDLVNRAEVSRIAGEVRQRGASLLPSIDRLIRRHLVVVKEHPDYSDLRPPSPTDLDPRRMRNALRPCMVRVEDLFQDGRRYVTLEWRLSQGRHRSVVRHRAQRRKPLDPRTVRA